MWLAEVEVRARFFGGEGGERLSTAVKDIEKPPPIYWLLRRTGSENQCAYGAVETAP